jgi:hypothetical protein
MKTFPLRRGKNFTFDSMPAEHKVSDLTFTVFDAGQRGLQRIKKPALTKKDCISFKIRKPNSRRQKYARA